MKTVICSLIYDIAIEASMSFYLDLKNRLSKEASDRNYKIWSTKSHIVVIDIQEGLINLAIDTVRSETSISVLCFGRDIFSRKLLNDFLILKNNWGNKEKNTEGKIILKRWEANEEIETVASYLIDLADTLRAQVDEAAAKETFECINEIKQITYENVKKRISESGIINVGFLVTERQKWNCQSLWNIFNSIPHVNCRIYLHAYSKEVLPDQLAFFKKIDPDLICLYDTKLKKNNSIREYNLDFIFCQQPWTGLANQLKNTVDTSLVLYMHYGFLVYANSRMQYQLEGFHPLIWRYFSQSELQKEIHLKYDPSMEGRQVVTGYPKLDVYLDPIGECNIWPEESVDKKRIIYAPHHSLKRSALRISTFSWNYNLMLELTRRYKAETQWVYKPHGRLRFAVEHNDIMSSREYIEYLEKWEQQGNTTIYDEGNYFDLFRTSDVLITDCGSFLGEYFPTGKPIIWLVSDIAKVELNEVGEKLSKGFYKVRTKKELIDTFEQVVIKGNDPLKELREIIIKEIFPLNQKSAEAVADFLMTNFN